MQRSELEELHYITAIDNLGSILEYGILSHRRTQELEHTSIAMDEIQRRRAGVTIPQGHPLHEYACLYICGRNPMLYKRRGGHRNICVLRVSPDVLDLPGAVVADGNASSKYVRFAAAPWGLQIVDRELTFAEDWTDADQIMKWRKAAAKCAELLVPDRVDPKYIQGCYVSCEESRERVNALVPGLNVIVDAHFFFV